MNIDSIQEQRAKNIIWNAAGDYHFVPDMLPMKKRESQASTSIALLVPSIVTTTMLPSMICFCALDVCGKPISFADWSGLDWNAVLMSML